MRTLKIFLALLPFLFASCGGGGGSSQSVAGPGTAPVIQGLGYTPQTASLGLTGQTTLVTCSFTFHDAEGDVAFVHLKSSDGSLVSFPLGSELIVDGVIEGEVDVLVDQLGVFNFEVWVTDSRNNSSNHLTGVFEVTWPDERDLDAGFGAGGVAIYEADPHVTYDEGRAVALLDGGKIAVAGIEGQHIMVVRFLSGGNLDASYGASGVFRYDGGSNGSTANAVKALPGGSLLVAGSRRNLSTGEKEAFLMKLTEAGALDPAFGTGGVIATPVGYDAESYALDLDSQGRIVAGGLAFVIDGPQTYEVGFLARYTSGGVLDTSFGTGGLATAPMDEARDLAVTGDGKILLAGKDGPDAVLVAFTAEGALDAAFGQAGRVVYSGGPSQSGMAVLAAPSGRIIIGGLLEGVGSGPKGFLAAYTSTGGADAAFGTQGVTTFDAPGGIAALAFGPGGKIAATGYGLMAARFTEDGALDSTFSGNGWGVYPTRMGWDVKVQTDGSIVVAGYSNFHDNASTTAFMAARFLPTMNMP